MFRRDILDWSRKVSSKSTPFDIILDIILDSILDADVHTCAHSLPGSIVERQLHRSYMRMLPELRKLYAYFSIHSLIHSLISSEHFLRVLAVRYSSASRLLSCVPEEFQRAHRTDIPNEAIASSSASLLWEGWEDANEIASLKEYRSSDEESVDLSQMGL